MCQQSPKLLLDESRNAHTTAMKAASFEITSSPGGKADGTRAYIPSLAESRRPRVFPRLPRRLRSVPSWEGKGVAIEKVRGNLGQRDTCRQDSSRSSTPRKTTPYIIVYTNTMARAISERSNAVRSTS